MIFREKNTISKNGSKGISDLESIHQLGEGWVAEETFSIAVYCALKYPDDFDRAVIAAVNHSGDSDSTGAVAGSIVGAHVGLSGIPQKYTAFLELKDVILTLADDLYYDCPITEYGPREGYKQDPDWEDKYIRNSYHP
ncbi:MAG: ADP-ribosylglycohydrolase family protein [Oscillospiraceae bacterium]|jgi:ADP-ribosylglycohydrolase